MFCCNIGSKIVQGTTLIYAMPAWLQNKMHTGSSSESNVTEKEKFSRRSSVGKRF